MLFLSTLEKSLLIGGCFILLAVIFFVIFLKVNNSKLFHRVREFRKQYHEVKTYLKDNIASSIHRFYVISQLNDEYQTHYVYFSDKKDDLSNKYIVNLNARVDKLNRLVEEKNKKQIKAYLIESYAELNLLKKEIEHMEGEIDVFLNRDLECHNHAVEYQKSYRKIRDFYDQNKESLEVINKSIQMLFDKIDNTFETFEKLAESAHYDEAIEKIDSLKIVFEAIEKAFEELPTLCARLNLVIPKKIEELNNLYLKLESETYPLYHLRVNATVEDIKTRLGVLKKQIENFAYKNTSIYLDEIEEKVESLMVSLQNEIESKTYFDENNEDFYQLSYDIEKDFLKVKRVLPEYKKVYEIKESYIDLIDDVQKDVSSLGNTRRELDNYIHASSMQPYSIVKKKLADLNDENQKVVNKLNAVLEYLKSLKNDSDVAYKLLNKTYISLKNLESKLSEMNSPVFEETLINEFKQAYSSLDNIGMLIKITPINVEALNLSSKKLIEIEKRIVESIEKNYPLMVDAENSIVYANQFRKDFFDVRQALSTAEEDFHIGNFQESFNTTVFAIKQVKKM